MAKPGTILVTRDTLRLAEGYVQVRPLGPVMVKGFDNPTEVYEITGVREGIPIAAPRLRLHSRRPDAQIIVATRKPSAIASCMKPGSLQSPIR